MRSKILHSFVSSLYKRIVGKMILINGKKSCKLRGYLKKQASANFGAVICKAYRKI